jgi:transposase
MIFCFVRKISAMAKRRISMDIINQIKILYKQGTGIKTIARQLGISKNTVKGYLNAENQQRVIGPLPDHPPDRNGHLLSYLDYCREELKRKGVTRQILWAEYLTQYPGGYSYSQFCYYLQQYLQSQQATLHIEQQPGEKMYIDFAGHKLSITDIETGEVTPVELFVSVLGYSGYTYARAVMSQKKEDFLFSVVKALEYCGGSPKVLVPDNLKSCTDKADKYEPTINRDLLDLGNHYTMGIMPARSRKPRDKAWVERMVSILYTRIYAPLRNRIFTSIEELNQAIEELLTIHNTQPLQGFDESRLDLFLTHEKPLLQPLPQEAYELKEYLQVKVMKNCHVQLHKDRHYYSVPYRYIGKKVKIIYTATFVSIYCDGARIAYHLRDRRLHKYTTLTDHLPSTHQFVCEWNPEKFLTWADRIAPEVKEYINMVLENKSYPEQTYRSCVGILAFDKKAGRERLINACKRAMDYGVYNYKVIEKIINNKLDRSPSEKGPQKVLPFHENLRGPEYYK